MKAVVFVLAGVMLLCACGDDDNLPRDATTLDSSHPSDSSLDGALLPDAAKTDASTSMNDASSPMPETRWSDRYAQDLLPLDRYAHDFAKDGYIDASRYEGVDPSGERDSTLGLQKAIQDGIDNAKITYLPAGTYLVSDTLFGTQEFRQSGCSEFLHNYLYRRNSIRKAAVLVGGLGGERPTIKLKDGSAGFGNKARPKSILRFTNSRDLYDTDRDWQGGTDCHMSAAIRGIIVDVGSNNPGAIGIEFPAAQYSTMEDVKVIARDGYAGVRGVPSVNINVGVEVIGGDYGIMPEVCCGISFVGVRLREQKKAGFRSKSYASIGITGFDIDVREGTPIEVVDGGGSHTSQLVLLDGKIRTREGATAIDNRFGADLHLNNVFITGSTSLLRSADSSLNGNQGRWNRIVEYSYTDQRSRRFDKYTIESVKLINGQTHKNLISIVNEVDDVPTDLVDRHHWQAIPSQFGTTVFNIKQDGGAKGDGQQDDTDAIQDAINNHRFVFLPAGDYQISKTLHLKRDTVLIGATGAKTRLFADRWAPDDFTPMIESVDDAEATTYLGDIYVRLPKGKARTYLNALNWRAGRRSWIRHLYIDAQWSNGDFDAHGRKVVDISGNGGGRHYGLTIHWQSSGSNSNHPEHRFLRVKDTHEPLTLYGSNLEHGKTMQVEIRDAQNVRLIGGMKFESFYALEIFNSQNIMVSGMAAHSGLMRVIDSRDIYFPSFVNYAGLHDRVKRNYMFEEVHDGRDFQIMKKDNMSLFKRGVFDFSKFID